MSHRLPRPLDLALLALCLLALPCLSLAQPVARPAAPLAKAVSATAPANANSVIAPPPRVLVKTSSGSFVIELYPDKAPKTVANFLTYVHDGFYAGTVFQRVIKGFLIQGGLFNRQLQPKPTRPPIPIEADNGLSNLRGTVAAARAADPNSETSQFFINLVDNPRLDFISDQSGATWGYTVFGKVIEGMNVVDAIGNLPTGPQGPFTADVPRPLPVIESMTELPADAALPMARPARAKPGAVHPAG
ncbi:MAG: peptidylprolyl isomerase [Proteobacteria bacterium]|nr:peptidylprolyl isomerase [Pseudomonadota bacterium]